MAFANPSPDVGLHLGYDLMTLRPSGFEPKVSGLDFLPNGDMLVLTWRGSTGIAKLYRVTNTQGLDSTKIVVGNIFRDSLF